MDESYLSVLLCPLCQQHMHYRERSLVCPQNHCFDQAKQGYFNLLPVQHKASKQPGDDKQMITARHQFLQRGFYQPFSDALNQNIAKRLTRPASLILDSGCGEGYYAERLIEHCKASVPKLIGLDIAKAAVMTAARRSKSALWLVASGAKAPLQDQSIDLIYSLFTPLAPAEMHRLLSPEGSLIIASAGTNHLLELRQLLYPEVQQKRSQTAAQLESHFSLSNTEPVHFQIELDDVSDIQNLLMMTPHYWRAKPEVKNSLNDLSRLALSIDIQLQTYSPRPI